MRAEKAEHAPGATALFSGVPSWNVSTIATRSVYILRVLASSACAEQGNEQCTTAERARGDSCDDKEKSVAAYSGGSAYLPE